MALIQVSEILQFTQNFVDILWMVAKSCTRQGNSESYLYVPTVDLRYATL